MAKINLLAGELAPKANVLRIVNSLKSFALVGLVIFIVSVSGMVGLFLINSQRLSASNERQARLKSSIGQMGQTEQQFYLLKDRLAFFGGLVSPANAGNQLTNLIKLSSNMPVGAQVTQVEVSEGKVKLTVSAVSSSALAAALRNVITESPYKSVRLTGYSFNRTSGHAASFTLAE